MIYLDSSVFLNASLRADERGESARKFLTDVQSGKSPAATSALTYDEVFWITKKRRNFEAALDAAEALLEMPNLTILAVDADALRLARKLSADHGLNPRDAIHAACALANGIRTMISEDPDFDRVKEIERKSW